MSQGRAARTAAASALGLHERRRPLLRHAAVPRQRAARQPVPGRLRRRRRGAATAVLRLGVPARRATPPAAPTSTTSAGRSRTSSPCPRPPDDADNAAEVVPRVGGVAARPQGVPAPVRLLRGGGLQLQRGRGGDPALLGHAPGRAGPARRGRRRRGDRSRTPGVECPRARFGDGHVLLNPGEAIGEIVGRDGLSSFEGYYANPEATAERGRDGWYWTGDLGYRDEDGTFWFAGPHGRLAARRRRELRGRPGRAGARARCPGVAAVVVYAVPDPRTGDQVMAAIELDAGAAFDPDAFAAFARRAARPRHEVGAAVRADRRGHPGDRHPQGRPQAAARRALGHARSGVVAAGTGRRVPAA